MPFPSCFRTFRSVALSIFGRPSFTPWATARLSRWRIIVRSNSAKAPVSGRREWPVESRVASALDRGRPVFLVRHRGLRIRRVFGRLEDDEGRGPTGAQLLEQIVIHDHLGNAAIR